MLDVLSFGLAFVSAIFGAVIQGAIGFGLNLVVVPVVALLWPEALPTSLIVMAIPMTIGSALRERDAIDLRGMGWVSVGRIPGVVAGAWLVSALASDTLARVTGGLVVAAALMSIFAPRLRVTTGASLVVGLVSGVMGTSSSIGGPPVALLYQHEPGPVVRSTLGATFAIGVAMSLAALAVAGEIHRHQVWLGVALMPAIGIGLYASRWLHHAVDTRWLRPGVLGFAIVSGAVVLLRGFV